MVHKDFHGVTVKIRYERTLRLRDLKDSFERDEHLLHAQSPSRLLSKVQEMFP
jgi:hypothetical protein